MLVYTDRANQRFSTIAYVFGDQSEDCKRIDFPRSVCAARLNAILGDGAIQELTQAI